MSKPNATVESTHLNKRKPLKSRFTRYANTIASNEHNFDNLKELKLIRGQFDDAQEQIDNVTNEIDENEHETLELKYLETISKINILIKKLK